MKKERSWFVVACMAFAMGCGKEAPPNEDLQARIKAQTQTITATESVTATITQTATQTSTSTQTETYTQTSTYTQTQTATGSSTTKTATASDLLVSGTNAGTVTVRNDYVPARSYLWTATLTRADTAGTTFSKTATASGTYADSGVTHTGSGTTTATMQFSSFATSTTTKTVPAYYTGAVSKTMMATGTGTGWNGSITWTYTKSSTGSSTNTLTQTQTQTLTQTTSSTATSTVTVTNTITNTITSTTTTTATSTDTSVDGGTGPAPGCLQDWRSTTCGQWCTRETQWDRRHCTDFLDCYFANGIGPNPDPDGTCGVNTFSYGMAPKLIADQVYQCLACPGTTPVTSCTDAPDTAPCTDNNPCTQGERCQAGACVGGTEKACPGDQCNDPGTCNPATGQCVLVPKNGIACNDANPCTQTDVCQAGTCVGQNPVVCTAQDQCHAVGTCSTITGTCNNPAKAGCTVSGTIQATAVGATERLFGAVVPRSDGTLWATGLLGAYRVDTSGTATLFPPSSAKRFAVDPVDGAHVGVVSGGNFVIYDAAGTQQASVALPDNASVTVAPGRALAAMKLMAGAPEVGLTATAIRLVGEGRDVTIPVSDLRRSFLTRDYYIHTTTSEIIVHDFAGNELHRYAAAADLMAASAASQAFAFVVHGTTSVVYTQLPGGSLGTPVALDAAVWNLALSPDGRFMVATTKQKVYLLLDGAVVNTVPLPVAYVNSADVSNEGLVVLGIQNSDQTTQLRGLGPQGVIGFTLSRPSLDSRGYHPSVRFTPNGQGFVSSERDGASIFNLSLSL